MGLVKNQLFLQLFYVVDWKGVGYGPSRTGKSGVFSVFPYMKLMIMVEKKDRMNERKEKKKEQSNCVDSSV